MKLGYSGVRMVIFVAITAGLIGALVTLWSQAAGGAIHESTRSSALAAIVRFYVPLLSLVCGYYFGAHPREGRGTARESGDRAIIALALTAVWCCLPAALIAFDSPIERAMIDWDAIRPFGDAVVYAALGFYFSGGKTR